MTSRDSRATQELLKGSKTSEEQEQVDAATCRACKTLPRQTAAQIAPPSQLDDQCSCSQCKRQCVGPPEELCQPPDGHHLSRTSLKLAFKSL